MARSMPKTGSGGKLGDYLGNLGRGATRALGLQNLMGGGSGSGGPSYYPMEGGVDPHGEGMYNEFYNKVKKPRFGSYIDKDAYEAIQSTNQDARIAHRDKYGDTNLFYSPYTGTFGPGRVDDIPTADRAMDRYYMSY